MAKHYWVWGGLLLGWSREARLLEHDLVDADFAFYAGDLDRFIDGARALMQSGFEPLFRFSNNAGEMTEYSLARNGAKFEFFSVQPSDGMLRYFLYSYGSHEQGMPIQATAELRDQPFETFRFLRRRWRKHVDHAAELADTYGEWERPDPDWWYMHDHAIVSRERWLKPAISWSGEFADAGQRRSPDASR